MNDHTCSVGVLEWMSRPVGPRRKRASSQRHRTVSTGTSLCCAVLEWVMEFDLDTARLVGQPRNNTWRLAAHQNVAIIIAAYRMKSYLRLIISRLTFRPCGCFYSHSCCPAWIKYCVNNSCSALDERACKGVFFTVPCIFLIVLLMNWKVSLRASVWLLVRCLKLGSV